MAHWEYLTTFLEARVKGDEMKQFIKERFDKKPRKHSPESMIPELNEMGTAGWELVHMEPLPRTGRKEDIQFDNHNWSSTYFCVFKRQVMPDDLPLSIGRQTRQAAPDTPGTPPAPEHPTPGHD
jgi:hypothetical protein